MPRSKKGRGITVWVTSLIRQVKPQLYLMDDPLQR